MGSSLLTKIIALLLSYAFIFTVPASGAQDATTHTRPRRVSTPPDARPPDAEPDSISERAYQPSAGEPLVRVGLVTNARSVTISTDSQLVYQMNASSTPVPFDVARVRIEPRSLPALPPPAEMADDAQADASVGAASVDESIASSTTPAASSKSATASNNSASKSPVAPSQAAQSTRTSKPSGSIRLAARVTEVVRGALLYAPGSTTPLLDVRAPVLLAAADEAQHPLRYNEKPYRGRLEVFVNRRGTLTVVNVLPLEDYVRGVVPNELSPGGYPALEALKAQAVAARTYAVSNRGQFAAEGFDLLPTTRSQVYGGRSTEHPLTDRAVEETRGRIATYKGKPINALYTSTCGGRTEHGESIFGGEVVPYLRARECALDAADAFAPLAIRTSRELPDIRDAAHASSARDAATLATHGFSVPARINDEWLASQVSTEEARALLRTTSLLARHSASPSSDAPSTDVTRPAAFATALALALDGESRGGVLLNSADVEYLLSFRDAGDIPQQNRADVALMLREGHLALYPDATLRPRQPLTRARVLQTLAHALESRGLLRLQKATARPAAGGALVLRPQGRGADRMLNVSAGAFLFRVFGENSYATREVNIVGGESVLFHTDARGEVDFLEVRPAPNGAASDHFSPYTNWSETLTPAAILSRLSRSVGQIGTILDLRVRSRGPSGRALDLEVTGTSGVAHIRGGRIRSALGLREQLFVIDRRYDEQGRLATFTFTGRGWGHGVGMCQVGAYGLARAGLSYDKILKSYYTGISLTKLY